MEAPNLMTAHHLGAGITSLDKQGSAVAMASTSSSLCASAVDCVMLPVRAKVSSAKVRDSLRAVSEFRALVTRTRMGFFRENFSQSARFVRENCNGFRSGSARSGGLMLEKIASDHWIYDGNESLI